jgi:hypothetical protein
MTSSLRRQLGTETEGVCPELLQILIGTKLLLAVLN